MRATPLPPLLQTENNKDNTQRTGGRSVQRKYIPSPARLPRRPTSQYTKNTPSKHIPGVLRARAERSAHAIRVRRASSSFESVYLYIIIIITATTSPKRLDGDSPALAAAGKHTHTNAHALLTPEAEPPPAASSTPIIEAQRGLGQCDVRVAHSPPHHTTASRK